MTNSVITPSMVKEATTFSAGDNRACSDGRCGEDKCGSSKRVGGRAKYGGSSEMGPLFHRNRPGKELLCLWRLWAHSLPLQESRSERKGSRE